MRARAFRLRPRESLAPFRSILGRSSPRSAHRESCVHGRGQSLTRHIAPIDSELPVGQTKIVEEIAAHIAERPQKIANFEISADERFPREKLFFESGRLRS